METQVQPNLEKEDGDARTHESALLFFFGVLLFSGLVRVSVTAAGMV